MVTDMADKPFVVLEKSRVKGHYANLRGKRVWIPDYERQTPSGGLLGALKGLLDSILSWKSGNEGFLTSGQRSYAERRMKELEGRSRLLKQQKQRDAVSRVLKEIRTELNAPSRHRRLDMGAIRMTPEEREIGKVALRVGKSFVVLEKSKRVFVPASAKHKAYYREDPRTKKADEPKVGEPVKGSERPSEAAALLEIIGSLKKDPRGTWLKKRPSSPREAFKKRRGSEPEPTKEKEMVKILGTTVNLRFRDVIRKYGYVSLLGQKLTSHTQLADLCKIYRNPMFETFRIFMMNEDNVVVGMTGISSHRPKEAPASEVQGGGLEVEYKILQERMKRLGATKYYLVHNHPAGDPDPSGMDMATTAKFNKGLAGFVGHIIVDHGQHSVLDSEGNLAYSTKVDEPERLPKDEDPLRISMRVHPALGEEIRNAQDIIHIVKSFQRRKDDYLTVLIRKDYGVSGIMEVPKKFFNNVEEAEAAVWRYALVGGGEAFIYGADDLNSKVMRELLGREVVRDIVTKDDASYLGELHVLGRPKTAPKVYLKEEEMVYKAVMDKVRSQRIGGFV